MGYFGKLELKEKAIELRSLGYSYNEIRKIVVVSKDTLSRWCRDVQLSDSQKKILLAKKINGQKKGSMIAASNKQRERIVRTEAIFSHAKKEIGNISDRDEFIFGLSLYAGEGSKTDGKGSFVNANPLLIKFMCKWLIKYCGLSKNDLQRINLDS